MDEVPMLVNPSFFKFQRLLALAAGRELANLAHCRNSTIPGPEVRVMYGIERSAKLWIAHTNYFRYLRNEFDGA
jgi:hypothetical protein